MKQHIDVFISSTSEDLQDYRRAVREVVLRMGLYPISMETFNPTERNALQKCYEEVQKAEIFIGIYAHRYGFCPRADMKYIKGSGDGKTSITHLEYTWALSLDIPILLFVISKADAENKPLKWPVDFIEPDPGKTRLNEFKQLIMSNHVVGFFYSPEHLSTQVATALSEILSGWKTRTSDLEKSPSLQVVDKNHDDLFVSLVQRMRERVLNYPIVPWVAPTSPSLDFIWPELFVDPIAKPQKHPSSPISFSSWEDQFWENDRRIVIVGPAGIGKSTSLLAMFLRHADEFISRRTEILPLFFHASAIISFPDEDIATLIKHLALEHGIEIVPASWKKQTLLFIDALDEVGVAVVHQLQAFFKQLPSNVGLVTTCRSGYFYENFAREPNVSSRFFEILELVPWEMGTVLNFANQYLNEIQKSNLLSTLTNAIEENNSLKSLLERPFQLTLILYLITSENTPKIEGISNIYSLYKEFYSSWLHKEHSRGSSWLPPEVVQYTHRLVAMSLYSNKSEDLSIGILEEIIGQKYPSLSLAQGDVINDTALTTLLDIRRSHFFSELRIFKFIHETLGEYHVAETVLDGLLKGGDDLSSALEIIYNYEVNLFIRDAFDLMPMLIRRNILENLINLYLNLSTYDSREKQIAHQKIHGEDIQTLLRKIPSPHGMNDIETKKREQILYYVGRLPVENANNVLSFAFHYETSPILTRIAAISAILHDNYEIEKEYLASLTPDSPADLYNRSVQLVYFGDQDGELGSYLDDGVCSWENTKKAICERLKKNGQRELRLRWWDLRTLFLFCASRQWRNQLSTDEIAIVKNTEARANILNQDKTQQIMLEKERILENQAILS